MNLKNLRPLFEVTLLSILAYIAHWFFFLFFKKGISNSFLYALWELYGFFFLCSVVIVSVLIKMKQKNIDSVGNTFMLLTCIKIVFAYALLHPILNAHHQNLAAEKANFFAIFALFLTFETIVAIRLLNKK